MSEIKTEHMFDVTIAVEMPLQLLGQTPLGDRRIAKVMGGSFSGPAGSGKVLPGGGDWILNRADGVTQLDVRLVLETDDGAMIYMTYKGLRHGPKDVMDRMAAGEQVNPADYYFRTTPFFETSSEKWSWINKCCCIATGDRTPEGPVYSIFKVL